MLYVLGNTKEITRDKQITLHINLCSVSFLIKGEK